MQMVQQGDRVKVHYVIRGENGTVASTKAHGRAPLELTVGMAYPRLPGLGLASGRASSGGPRPTHRSRGTGLWSAQSRVYSTKVPEAVSEEGHTQGWQARTDERLGRQMPAGPCHQNWQ